MAAIVIATTRRLMISFDELAAIIVVYQQEATTVCSIMVHTDTRNLDCCRERDPKERNTIFRLFHHRSQSRFLLCR